ncbi:ATP-binding protein [Kineosporia babensis]|uniref:LuxR C-terminal-related transcriptional regulator n=1 Tax=Kineosporia babensis TaxID=499548 RepID=A0A9X1NMS0_9ACTN|nr:LuxR C-terminal-related transcriptional regulator [Kineosporia babensis]MCD5317033.1 LuxR C-terminal-related transcriptional regulator [Kineosporia babensis]
MVGRDAELAVLSALVEGAAVGRGGALVLRGEAGVGKSALLEWAGEEAERAGLRLLSTAGVQAEVHIPYAAVHRLLHAVPGVREAVLAAPDMVPFRAATMLLTAIAEIGPAVLIAVDDLQWVDESSWAALAFVARRLNTESAAMVLTARDGGAVERRLNEAGLPERRLETLPEPDAQTLLSEVAPQLSGVLRAQVLDAAAGNPLGLIELGVAGAKSGSLATLPGSIALSERLERTFSGLVAELPAPTRALLLVAALDDGDDVDEIVRAGAALVNDPAGPEDLEPALQARLVQVNDQMRLRFRHPLLRSALQGTAGPARRRQAHTALADVLGADPERVLWHRAAAADRPDEVLASALDDAAVRARHRQAPGIAQTAFERAARLSEDPTARAQRLLAAADMASEQGNFTETARLLAEIRPQDLPVGERAVYELDVETVHATHWSGGEHLIRVADAIEALERSGDVARLVRLVDRIALRANYSEPDPVTVERLVAAIERAMSVSDDPQLLGGLGLIAPLTRGRYCRPRIRDLLARGGVDPYSTHLLGLAAAAVGDTPTGFALQAMAQVGLREQGRLGMLYTARISQAIGATYLGDARTAMALMPEVEELAREVRAPNWIPTACVAAGAAHALRGELDEAEEQAAAAESMLLAYGRNPLLAGVHQVRGLAALADGRFEEAFSQLHRIFEVADPGFHPSTGHHLLGFLAEAAAGCGGTAQLRRLVAELAPVAETSRSPALLTGLGYAEAVLSDTAEAYEKAVGEDLTGRPFELARRRHAYGAWLRRHRQPAESRPLLRAAAATFDSLGALAWAERSRNELRASGESLRRNSSAEELTPQERQIARLAAEGLSTREIAERLSLSPRTVSTHLSRIYRKLGIRSRSQLSRFIPNT